MQRLYRHLAATLQVMALFVAGPVLAQTYTPTLTQEPDIGIIVPAATTSTNFVWNSSTGNVTQSGSAVRRTSGTTRARVSIGCTGGGNVCGDKIRVKVGSIGTPVGKAGSLTTFTVTAHSGTISNSSGSNPRTFDIQPTNKNTPAAFYIGATMPITASNSAGTSGPAESDFYVYVAKSPTTPTTGILGTAVATTYRGVSFEGTPTLNFGLIVKPTSGTATVSLPASTGVRTVTGTTAGESYSLATYTIKGEGGLMISVTQATSVTMARSGGGTGLTVTLNRTTLPTQLGGAPGAEGTATFYTGGSFSVPSSRLIGSYSGSYNTTVSYN